MDFFLNLISFLRAILIKQVSFNASNFGKSTASSTGKYTQLSEKMSQIARGISRM